MDKEAGEGGGEAASEEELVEHTMKAIDLPCTRQTSLCTCASANFRELVAMDDDGDVEEVGESGACTTVAMNGRLCGAGTRGTECGLRRREGVRKGDCDSLGILDSSGLCEMDLYRGERWNWGGWGNGNTRFRSSALLNTHEATRRHTVFHKKERNWEDLCYIACLNHCTRVHKPHHTTPHAMGARIAQRR